MKICIVHHSGYGHTARQTAAVAEGVHRVDGVECIDMASGDVLPTLVPRVIPGRDEAVVTE